MPAYYKVDIKGKYEGFIIFKTATAKLEEVLKDQFLDKDEITNVELLFDSPETDDILEPIADLFNQIAGLGLAGRRLIRNKVQEYCQITWTMIEALESLTDTIEDRLKRLRLFLDCLGGWQMDVTKEKLTNIRERLCVISLDKVRKHKGNEGVTNPPFDPVYDSPTFPGLHRLDPNTADLITMVAEKERDLKEKDPWAALCPAGSDPKRPPNKDELQRVWERYREIYRNRYKERRPIEIEPKLKKRKN